MADSGLKTMQLNDQKAGMEGLDKEAINRIICDASQGSSYYAFQEKRQKTIDSKVNDLLSNLSRITEPQRKESLAKINAMGAILEQNRDLSRSIVHIDMDAFYAAVEMLDNPKLKDVPMAVGSSAMLSTSNYHARKFGVRAAMPGFIAKKLCPNLIIVPMNFEKYRNLSKKMRNVVKDYDPDYSSAGLDEVYLDVTDYIIKRDKQLLHQEVCLNEQNGDDLDDCVNCDRTYSIAERDQKAYEVVQEIRDRIQECTQLTASAGIAPNCMLAKVCSDQNKPNGQYQIISTEEAVKSFIATLPVKKVNGIGQVQAQMLNAIGVTTCTDMWDKRDIIDNLFSAMSVDFYMRIALGIGSTTVKSDYIRKSIGVEETFKEMQNPEELHKKCQELCSEMIHDLKSHHMLGKVVVLKIKMANFNTHTRNFSFGFYTADNEIIGKAAKKLLDSEIASVAPEPLKLRLMGIRMTTLVEEHSVPSNEKQQLKLQDFMQMKASTSKSTSPIKQTNFVCPICNKQITAELVKFNEHVDSCLEGTSDLCEDELKCINEDLNQDDIEDRTLSKTSEIVTSYSCPICGLEQNVQELSQLNSHIDSCLNKVAIREILKTSTDVPCKKRKSKSPKKSTMKKSKVEESTARKIDFYFQ